MPPWDKYQQAPQQDPVIATDPYKQASESRAAAGSNRDDARLAIEQQNLLLRKQQADREAQDAALKRGEEQQKLAKFNNAKSTATATISRVLGQIDDLAKSVHHNEGWWQVGKTGALVRDLPVVGKMAYAGSDAANFDAALKPIIANTAFQALQEMRQNSPTGGALGAVSDRETEMLQSTISSLNADQDYESFMRNLAQTKDAYLRMLGKLDPQQAHQVLGREGVWHVPSGGYFYGQLPKAGQDHHAGQIKANRPPLDAIFGK